MSVTPQAPTSAVRYDPYDVAIDDDPYPTWTRLREEAPLYRNDDLNFYALSRWDDVRPALRDWETYRSGRGTVLEVVNAGVEIPPGILLWEDPPIHDAHRALLSRVFTPRRMLDLRTAPCGGYASPALDALVGGRDEFGVISEFGIEVPLRTIGLLFGHPEDIRTTTASRRAMRSQPMGHRSCSTSHRSTPSCRCSDYVDWLEEPGDDLMTELLNAEVDEADGTKRPLTRDEVAIYANMVAGAGNETATRLIGFTMQLLAQHPIQRRLLAHDPRADPGSDRGDPSPRVPSPVQARCPARR
jgi:cytochrome P450